MLSLIDESLPLVTLCISSCFVHLVMCMCHIKPCEGQRERVCHFTVGEMGANGTPLTGSIARSFSCTCWASALGKEEGAPFLAPLVWG